MRRCAGQRRQSLEAHPECQALLARAFELLQQLIAVRKEVEKWIEEHRDA